MSIPLRAEWFVDPLCQMWYTDGKHCRCIANGAYGRWGVIMGQQASLTERLADLIVGAKPTDSAPVVLDAAKYYLLDWLGSAMAGTATVPGRIFLDHAFEQGGGRATVVGLAEKQSAEIAALTNGALSHIVEMDDLHRASVVHPGAVVIPAALAVAEELGASGLDVLNAIVLGYEVAIRVGEAVGNSHYRLWHNTATCGIFGSTAAAGRLLGLTVEQMAWALGSAGTMAGGLWEFNSDGAMSKPLHAGRAASDGVLAADLAQRGLTGARYILEGERGFFNATSQDADPMRVVDGLSPDMGEYRITGVSIKPHASCRHTHPAIDAALQLRARLDDAVERIAQVTIEGYRAVIALTDNPAPEHSQAAKFSVQYCVASALLRGRVGLREFEPAAVAEPAIRRLMTHVRVVHNPALDAQYPAAWPARVSVTLDDGRMLTEQVDDPKGDPENPLSWDEVEGKFRQMIVGTMWDGQGDEWIERVRTLEQEPVGASLF